MTSTCANERHFLAARKTVAEARARKQRILEKLAMTNDRQRRRELEADLLTAQNILDRAIPALNAARGRVER